MWTKLPPSCSCQKNGWLLVTETERDTSRDLDRGQGVQDQCACLWPKLSQVPAPALLEPRDLTGIPSGPTPSYLLSLAGQLGNVCRPGYR